MKLHITLRLYYVVSLAIALFILPANNYSATRISLSKECKTVQKIEEPVVALQNEEILHGELLFK